MSSLNKLVVGKIIARQGNSRRLERKPLNVKKTVLIRYAIYLHHFFQKIQLTCVNPSLFRLKLQPPYTMQGAWEKLQILLVSEKAVSCIVKNVTEIICQHLGSKFIKLPLSENEFKHVTYCFEKVHGFPQCLGSVDGAHVNIKTPKKNSMDFINRKGHHPVNLHACVNYNYCFFDVVVKWPGSVYDAQIWVNSSIN